jgi:hypothetical protein
MDSIILISATEDTPKIIGSNDGKISIIGKSIIEDPIAFYKPIHDWISQIKAENIEICIQLEYLNTSSSKQVFNLLKLAKENPWKKTILVKWFYDMNDDDELELGKEFESLLELPFEFYNFLDL